MKFLIVYFSHTENNGQLARLLKKRLDCDILKIEETKKRTGFTILFDVLFNRYSSIKTELRSLRDYDHIVFVAPIWASKIAAPMKTFLRRERDNIKEYSFATICSGLAGQKSKIEDQLVDLTGRPATNVLELWINDLLPESQKNKIRYVTNYRIDDEDLAFFESKIESFLAHQHYVTTE